MKTGEKGWTPLFLTALTFAFIAIKFFSLLSLIGNTKFIFALFTKVEELQQTFADLRYLIHRSKQYELPVNDSDLCTKKKLIPETSDWLRGFQNLLGYYHPSALI